VGNPLIPSRLHLAHTSLPAPELSLGVHTHEVAELSAWLLASRGAALAAIPLRGADRDAAMPVWLWNVAGEVQGPLSRSLADPSYPFRSVVRALERAAEALLLALEPRWPSRTPPAGLGVVTDGIGVGFCADDPDPRSPGWAARQNRDRNLTCLVPFAPGHILSGPAKPQLA